MKLKEIEYGGKIYPVEFKQTPNWSHTTMNKEGMVWHVTTSNSFSGAKSWLTNSTSQSSALFIVGREVGSIVQLGTPDQKFWHAGRVFEPHSRFINIAKKTSTGKYTNPNLYLDGTEFTGGEDVDKSKKVEIDEVELTEWQYHCGVIIAKWHAEVCNYNLIEKTQLIHQDIASYKPDLTGVLDEISFRLFRKDSMETSQCEDLQTKVAQQESTIAVLIRLIMSFINR